MKPSASTALRGGTIALLLAAIVYVSGQITWAQDKTTLFKIITSKDDIVIGLNAAELSTLGGSDAGAVARALAAKGELTAWQYGVKKAPNGDLQQAPLRKVGLLANASLRVEPYATPYAVLPHE